uniref:Uncharacterized protein n=1 Tax=Timema monikensis TaxID=170555 RepID=A0A7R9HNL5_9NEOP|nr:unnamed protein product [Timema monikensis]
MALIHTAEKLKRVLFRIGEINYQINGCDEIYLQKLIGHLSVQDKSLTGGLVKIPFCFEWIEQSIDLWDDAPPHPSIYSFALRLTGLMGSDRKKFRLLQTSGVVNRFRKQLEQVIKENASVALAYVDMLSGLLKHEEGCYWVVQSELWKDVIAFCVENKSIYLTRGSQTFVTDLVTKLQADEDWGACEKILSHIFGPLVNTFQVMPLLACLVTTKVSDDNFCVDTYCEKIHNITCEETLRIVYSFRNFLVDKGSHRQNSLQAVISIMQIKDYLSRDRGVIVFQALTYSLKDFIPGWPNVPVIKNECVLQYPELLSALLDGLTTLIEQFQITWRDSVESICLFTFTEQLLNNPCLSTKLAVKTLKLMQRTIQSYMPPNLALLVNTMGGSSINQLGPLIHKRMHDVSWEVRDSALELLHTIATISYVKFTAFQEHVLENELCSLALSLALDDSESYVRVSALKCLAAMVMVGRYWTDCLCSKNLPFPKEAKLLKTKPVGTLKRAAYDPFLKCKLAVCKTIADECQPFLQRFQTSKPMTPYLFEAVEKLLRYLMNRCVKPDLMKKPVEDEIYQAMTIAATSDLYWEVKVNVLTFWEKVIEQQMSDQGMIDGVFPNVTFSKENRKIVTLTSEVIKLRLNKALEELARLGCLQALLSGIYDCDLQVVHKAVAITQSLLDLLYKNGVSTTNTAAVSPDKKFKITNGCKDICSPESPSDSMSETPPHSLEQVDDSSTSDSPARVIETIVFDSDINLLSKVYHRNGCYYGLMIRKQVRHMSVQRRESPFFSTPI